jgi:hypothetical protein
MRRLALVPALASLLLVSGCTSEEELKKREDALREQIRLELTAQFRQELEHVSGTIDGRVRTGIEAYVAEKERERAAAAAAQQAAAQQAAAEAAARAAASRSTSTRATNGGSTTTRGTSTSTRPTTPATTTTTTTTPARRLEPGSTRPRRD